MEIPPTKPRFRFGDWCVDPSSTEISRNNKTVRLDFRAMQLLVCLAENAGKVVSIEDLLNTVWQGVAVSPDSVYQAVTSLRRQLGDDPKNPAYIETVPRQGYRMIAQVSTDNASGDGNRERSPSFPRKPESTDRLFQMSRGLILASAAALCAVLFFAAFLLRGNIAGRHASTTHTQKTIAVLPFLDLTEGMHEETFADGMTEELIDRLSKLPGLQVPAPTSSFFYKGKQIAVADIAKALGVTYVLDGSVRKSGDMIRVAARLVRADNGYVMWSETYDRSFHDILMVQDDIASEVAKALAASIQDARQTPQ